MMVTPLTLYIIISKDQIKMQFHEDKHQQFVSKFKIDIIYKFFCIDSQATEITDLITSQ